MPNGSSGGIGGVSGVILAGGQSRRLGRDKAREEVGGLPLIQRVVERARHVTSEIVIVVNDAVRFAELPLPPGCRPAVDTHPGKGSLGGIYSGLRAAAYPWALVVACDMPFLSLDLLRLLLGLREEYDAVVPLLEGRPEPTHALYHQRCLPEMERRLLAGDLKIADLFSAVNARRVPQGELALLDPNLLSFFNVNTPQDLAEARRLAALGH